jgi:hypothetical protein
MASQIIIEGKVYLKQTETRFAGVRIELWNKSEKAEKNDTPAPPLPSPQLQPIISEMGYGWLTSTITDSEGNFTFYINEPLTGIISDLRQLNYRVYKNNIFIKEGIIDDYLKAVTILIEEAEYDIALADNRTDPVKNKYISFSGTVWDDNGSGLTKSFVCIYESGFRAKTLLAKVPTDNMGRYEAKISSKYVNNYIAYKQRCLRIEIEDMGGEVVDTSADIFGWENTDSIVTDFKTKVVNDDNEFHYYSVLIADVIGSDEIGELIVDLKNNVNEVKYVAEATGISENSVANLVQAYKVATEQALNTAMLYALVKVAGNDPGAVKYLNEEQGRDIIAEAVSANIIESFSPEDIDTFIENYKLYQIGSAKGTGIIDEDYLLNDVLLAIFSDQAEVDVFLLLYNATYEDANEFWAAYENEAGPELRALAELGLKLATITGFQPQTITRLISVLDGGDIRTLAEWDFSTWADLIADICDTTGILCVPASIRQGATDPEDITVQQDYAKMLMAIAQSIYPMAYIASQLAGEAGEYIIPDSVKRNDVITFIQNNPTFDSRITAAYLITADDWNLKDISSLDTLKAGLLPFQRLFRLTGGNPKAVCTLIIDGISSAYDIVSAGWDSFSEKYEYLFPVKDREQGSQQKDILAVDLIPAHNIDHVYSGAISITSVLTTALAGSIRERLADEPEPTDAEGGAMMLMASTPAVNDPTLEALFGNLDYCACCDCKSIYSPAAYLLDTLKFLKDREATTPSNPIYTALLQKRPDIINVDLTCKNTDTPMPYIDLVNELLEIEVAGTDASILLPANLSFQTSGTEQQLAAYPEHIYKDSSYDYKDFTEYMSAGGVPSYTKIYQKLSNAVFPTTLPFDMPVEEARTYVRHLGVTRLELMKLFCPVNQASFVPTPPVNSITDYAIYTELLGLTVVEATIVDGTHIYCTIPEVFRFYGSPTATASYPDPMDPGTMLPAAQWENLLSSRIDVLIQQAGITYDELLQYLTTDYLNPINSGLSPAARNITIVTVTASPPIPEDTCELNKLRLRFSDNAIPASSDIAHRFYKKLHRFIRLVKTGKLSIYQWDILLRSIGITDTLIPDGINNLSYFQLGRIMSICDELKIAPEYVAMWWNNTDTHAYINYPQNSTSVLQSVYDRIFNNKNVINNSINNAFANPTPGGLPSQYTGYTAQIANFCNITEDEVFFLLSYLSVNLATPILPQILSRLYVLSSMSKVWGYSISDLINILDISAATVNTANITGFGDVAAFLDNLKYLLDTIKAIGLSKFSLPQINYLINSADPADAVAPSPLKIQLFYEDIRSELSKNPVYIYPVPSPPDAANEDLYIKLTNIIYQHFSKEFNLSLQLVRDIFTLAPGDDTLINLLDKLFVGSSYPLSEDNINYIDTLTPGTPITSPPDDAGNIVPYFELHTFYDWYRYCFKINLIIKQLKLRTKEFEYLFFNVTAIDFNFRQLPISIQITPAALLNILGVPVGVSTEAALYGLLRMDRMMDIVKRQILPEESLGRLLDATRGILTPVVEGTVPPPPITPTDPTYLTDINKCFVNWLSVLNQDTWGTMLYELVGNQVLSSALTVDNLVSPIMDSLLKTYFSVTTSVSDYTAIEYKNIDMVINILDILYWCKRIGLTPITLQKTLLNNISPVDSRNLIIAVRGKYNDNTWADIAKPLRDEIRVKQRDALIAFQNKTSNRLFAELLIDVEMDSCMITSRVKQAISSVQLYIDRIMLGLEYSGTTQLKLASVDQAQWQKWRKWYSTWEANRKIFFYPEDWMEPELRDDKTAIFEELEAELKQDAVNLSTAQDALLHYLQKVNDVSRLEPVGTCDQKTTSNQTITHVFSRTQGGAHTYYHRTLTNDVWNAWEKIDIEIASDHIVPYVWNNRLYVFWLTFAERTAKFTPKMAASYDGLGLDITDDHYFYNDTSATMSEYSSNSNDKTYTQIIVTLNWTEYKNGRWQNQKTGSEKMTFKIEPWLAGRINSVYAWNNIEGPVFKSLMNNNQVSVMDFVRSRIYLQPYAKNDLGYAINTIGTISPTDLYMLVDYPKYLDMWGPSHTEYADFIKCFHLTDSSDKIEILNNVFFYSRLIPPVNTYYKNMNMTTVADGQGLAVDNYFSTSAPVLFNYDTNTRFVGTAANGIRERAGWNNILKAGFPLSKYKVSTKAGYVNPMEDKFMYEDNKNTYFVRKTSTIFSDVPFYVIDLTSTSQTSYYLYSSFPIRGFSGFAMKGGSSGALGGAAGGGKVVVLDSGMYDNTIPIGGTPGGGGVIKTVTGNYLFQTLYHPHISTFIRMLNLYGIEGFMRPDTLGLSPLPIVQVETDSMNFSSVYQPTSLVRTPYPDNTVDFTYIGSYSIYNWEIFFHTPMLIAQRLSDNQQFYDAQKWYHFIFDPTSQTYLNGSGTVVQQRFWKFFPFYLTAGTSVQTVSELLMAIQNNDLNAIAQVNSSIDNPFQPFAIARMRIGAFMKNVVMKYLDNLIAWGDYLFRQDTIESINEATQLYILASDILGNKPTSVPQRVTTLSYNFRELASSATGIDAIGDALVAIEGYIDPAAPTGSASGTGGTVPSLGNIFYFCLQPNDKLLAYWDVVADRLFKIRHCENISGIERQLPIFEPPIDPALLVQATAAGVDISSVLDDLSGASLPGYRFTYMVQKANEFCGDVKALGASLLSALEKQDAELLALLRQGQEINVLQAMLQMKQLQVNEANANLDALYKTKESIQARFDYYSSRQYSNSSEEQFLNSLKVGMGLQIAEGVVHVTSGIIYAFPTFHLQGPSSGMSAGGGNLGQVFTEAASALGVAAAISNTVGSMANTKGSWDRRMEDWQFQANSATLEMAQVDKQIIAAQVRIAIAQQDLDNQKLQIDNAKSINSFMTTKFTNEHLYDWMVKQISVTYFQAYQLAYNMARKAEQCYKKELPLAVLPDGGFITPGYWDSLRKGLLAAEKLQYDIRNMEVAYISDNKRTLELTKHVSLAMLQPDELVRLKANGYCSIHIPEGIYDLDYPGHFNRMIKSVSLSVPCVAGPYTTIPCTLTHTLSYVRRSTTSPSSAISTTIHDVPCASIATSSAQNDSGVFDFNFRDERYLPFEGAGAVSTWTLSLGNASSAMTNEAVRNFDYNTISDVVLHIKYTATDGGGDFANTRAGNLRAHIQANIIDNYPGMTGGILLPRYFSLKHEFPNEWYKFINDIPTHLSSATLGIDLALSQFPFFAQGHKVTGVQLGFAKRLKTGATFDFNMATTGYLPQPVATTITGPDVITGTQPEITDTAGYHMNLTVTPPLLGSLEHFNDKVDDIYMVLIYKVTTI